MPSAGTLAERGAKIGMRLHEGGQFPAGDKSAIIVAGHGSWNHAEKSGDRSMTVRRQGGKVLSDEPLIAGLRRAGGHGDGPPTCTLSE